MIPKAAHTVMIFAVHIVSDGTADSHQLGAWGNRQHPAVWNQLALDIPQQNAGLAVQSTSFGVKSDEAVETCRLPQYALGVKAYISVAAAHAPANAGPVPCDDLLRRCLVSQGLEVMGGVAEASPGRNVYHGQPLDPSTSTNANATPDTTLALSLTANTSGSSCIRPRLACIHIQLTQNSMKG